MNSQELFVFGLTIIAVIFVLMGFHHIDNGWNMDSACWDQSLNGEEFFTKNEVYALGVSQTFLGLMCLITAVILSNVSTDKRVKSVKPYS